MIENFLQYLQYEKSYSSCTVLSYETDLKQLESYLAAEGLSFNPDELSTEQVRMWMVWLMEQGMSVSSIHRKLSSLKSFYRYLNRKELCVNNPTSKVIAPKRSERLPNFFQEKDLDHFLEFRQKCNTFEEVRDVLIVDVFYQTGIRCSELVNLEDFNVDLIGKSIKVLGKRNKERIIPFGEDLKRQLESYREWRNKEVESRTSHFFVRKDGGSLTSDQVYQIVTRKMSMVSSQQKRSPHVLRHTFATSMLNSGADLNAVKELLGHSSLAATQIYTHSTFEQLYQIYEQAHPRVKKKDSGG